MVVLRYVYSLPVEHIHLLMGVSERSVRRWMRRFEKKGTVEDTQRTEDEKSSRYPQNVFQDILAYVGATPTFYLEELQEWIKEKHPGLPNVSIPTLCRALRHDLQLTRKVSVPYKCILILALHRHALIRNGVVLFSKRIESRAREASLREQMEYSSRLARFYSHPEQLVFLDESSKDGRSIARLYGRSRRGKRCIQTQTFSRGKRVSVLAALAGFFAWGFTQDTFDRHLFHETFVTKILPQLSRFPLPRSIVIMDNARIHMYK